MAQITYLPLTSCIGSVFHKSTRSQLDRQKSYTATQSKGPVLTKSWDFFPLIKKQAYLKFCQKRLKWIISAFDFVVSAKTKISEIYKQKFLSSFRVQGKKKPAFTDSQAQQNLKVTRMSDIFIVAVAQNFHPATFKHGVWEFTKIASATLLVRSYNLNTK